MMLEYSKGDVFALYMERLGLYVPIQMIQKSEEDDSLAIALVLNWFGKDLSDFPSFEKLDPLLLTYHSWEGRELIVDVDFSEEELVYLGNFPSLFEEKENISVHRIRQIESQFYWNQLSQETQKSFKANKRATRITIYQIEESEDYFARLQEDYPFLYDLVSRYPFPALYQFVLANPFIWSLEIQSSDNLRTLDFSQTKLNSLDLDVSGLECLILNERIQNRYLKGDFSDLKEIRCPFQGKYLDLRVDLGKGDIGFQGLEKLRNLNLISTDKNKLDIDRIASCLPDLRFLLISGQGTHLNNILSLKKLKQLRNLWILNCYGFDEFPIREDLAALRNLSLIGIPKQVGPTVKKEFGDLKNFEVRQLRTPEWVKMNLGNPFANWDDKEGLPKTIVRKAVTSYKKAYQTLGKTKEETEQKRILSEFIKLFNQIDRKYPLDTLDDERIFGAFKELVTLTKLEEKEAEKIFEQNREF